MTLPVVHEKVGHPNPLGVNPHAVHLAIFRLVPLKVVVVPFLVVIKQSINIPDFIMKWHIQGVPIDRTLCMLRFGAQTANQKRILILFILETLTHETSDKF